MPLISVEDALARLLTGAVPLAAETVPLADAAYRALAQPIVALRTQPPFPAAAMDGYAFSAELGRTRFSVIGESAAGRGFQGTLTSGQAVRIFTGAPVPEGADTVAMQENVAVRPDAGIELIEPVTQGKHVRKRGLDFTQGAVVMPAGQILDPAALSLAAACGHATVAVVRRPRVVIIATGDELVAPGDKTGPDQIVASNGYGTAALARKHGADVSDYGIIPDQKPLIQAAIERALAERTDIIITLGGASVGDHDLIRPVLSDLGIALDVWQIAMRPGKPLMFGKSGSTHILGLPGNPVSSLVCGQLFLAPLIAALAGQGFAQDIRLAALTEPMRANDHRQDYVRAKIALNSTGLTAAPFAVQDSSMLTTLANANGLIIRPPNAVAAAAGAQVKVLMLRPLAEHN
jgi:molybdopterin molybdotransferase